VFHRNDTGSYEADVDWLIQIHGKTVWNWRSHLLRAWRGTRIAQFRQLPEQSGEKRIPELGTRCRTVARCSTVPGALHPSEPAFLRDLTKSQRLSVKQRYALKEIANRALGAER
jgi:hypothetical protein